MVIVWRKSSSIRPKAAGQLTAPSFDEMIQLAHLQPPPFEAILVWKLNRFSRSRLDSVTYKTLLRNKGVAVISINEPIDDSPTGRLIEGAIESIDEFYSANLGQDIKRGMRENASRGYFDGSRPPFGFQRVSVNDSGRTRYRLEPASEDSVSVQTVRRIYNFAMEGVGTKQIAITLNADGFRTSTNRRWGRVTVHKILTNEAHKGTLVWGGRAGHPASRSGGEAARVDNAWKPIVKEEVFHQVQKSLASRVPKVTHLRTVSSRYLLSGLLFCRCGRSMTGKSAKSGDTTTTLALAP